MNIPPPWVVGSSKNVSHRRVIGLGGYGEVHELFDEKAERPFARKIIRLFPGHVDEIDIENEARVVKELCRSGGHPNIVAILQDGRETYQWIGDIYFIDMELCDMNLHDYIHGERKMLQEPDKPPSPVFVRKDSDVKEKMRNVWEIMIHISMGLEFLHDQGQVHRDLKPSNILYSSSNNAWKLADFGTVAKAESTNPRTTILARGTTCYRAPELLGDGKRIYTKKVDIWALGCILYELTTCQYAFRSDIETREYRQEASARKILPPEKAGPHLQSFLDETFHRDWNKRPSATDTKLACISLSRLLDPALTDVTSELRFALAYSEAKELSIRFPTRRQFLYYIAELHHQNQAMLLEIQGRTGETALHWAALKGHSEILEALLAANKDVLMRTKSGDTALHYAARSGNPEAVRLLLTANSNVNARDYQDVTPLHWAAWNGHDEVVKMLLSDGADPSMRKVNGATAIHWAAWNGHVKVVELLLNDNPDLVLLRYNGETALHRAAQKGHTEVVRILLQGDANPLAQTRSGETALHWAACKGWVDVVDILLEAKTDPPLPLVANRNGEIALHWAAIAGHNEIVTKLLTRNPETVLTETSNGQSVLRVANRGGNSGTVRLALTAYSDVCASTPDLAQDLTLHHMILTDTPEVVRRALTRFHHDALTRTHDGDTLLHWAAFRGEESIVELLLNEEQVLARNKSGDTPLHYASRAGHIGVINMLLQAGANVHACTDDGESPLHWAAWNGHVDIIEALIDVKADISVARVNGGTPLHWAAWNKQKDAVCVLLKAGANTTVEYNDDGETPLHRAARTGDISIVQMILDAMTGADFSNRDGVTALHTAALGSNYAVVELLCSHDKIVGKTADGDTALHWAVTKGDDIRPMVFFPSPAGDAQIVELLLRFGADIFALNGQEVTPLRLALEDGTNEVIQTLLTAATSLSSLKRNGGSLLHLSIAESNDVKLREILADGSDLLAIDRDGETALHLAAKNGDVGSVKIILAAHANQCAERAAEIRKVADTI